MQLIHKISGLSDMEFEVIFRNEAKEEMPVPGYPFRIYYYTTSLRKNSAYRDNAGNLHSCSVEDGHLHVFLDAPRFEPGVLRFRFEMDIPSDKFGDAVRTISWGGPLGLQVARPPYGRACRRIVHSITVTEADLSREFLATEEGTWLAAEDGHRLKLQEDYGIGDTGKKISEMEEASGTPEGFFVPGYMDETGTPVNKKFNLGKLDNVFVIQPGVTTWQEALDAYNAGKLVYYKRALCEYITFNDDGHLEEACFSGLISDATASIAFYFPWTDSALPKAIPDRSSSYIIDFLQRFDIENLRREIKPATLAEIASLFTIESETDASS